MIKKKINQNYSVYISIINTYIKAHRPQNNLQEASMQE